MYLEIRKVKHYSTLFKNTYIIQIMRIKIVFIYLENKKCALDLQALVGVAFCNTTRSNARKQLFIVYHSAELKTVELINIEPNR